MYGGRCIAPRHQAGTLPRAQAVGRTTVVSLYSCSFWNLHNIQHVFQ